MNIELHINIIPHIYITKRNRIELKIRMDNQLLIHKSCYICMEHCNTSSPCECKATVHRKCLMEFNIKRKKAHCTICQRKFRNSIQFLQIASRCCKMTRGYVMIVVLSVFAYIVCGFVGEYALSVLGVSLNNTVTFETTLTTIFMISSITMVLTFVLLTYCIKKCLNRN